MIGLGADPHGVAIAAHGFVRAESVRADFEVGGDLLSPISRNTAADRENPQAFVIAVPELLYQAITIWNDAPSAQNPMMVVLFVSYLALVGVVVAGMNRWERAMRIPGYGG